MAIRTLASDDAPLTVEQLRARFEEVGREQYHYRHPFHRLMHEGRLNRGQLQAWALNRYYYQSRIPIKDAIILSRSQDRIFRGIWRKRIVDHDGNTTDEGGIERWIRLAEATGLGRELITSEQAILPAVRYAVDAYLGLVRDGSLLEAVASSLTELFARDLIVLRVEALGKYYPWLFESLDYFRVRLDQSPEDARFAFQFVADQARTRGDQELAIAALREKCNILWAQLDALYFAYVQPGWPPPGAFIPAEE